MFDQYPTEVRKVISYARYEVSAIGGDTISTGHLALALIRIAPHLFENPNVLRLDLETRLQHPNKLDTAADRPLSPEARAALDLAVSFAKEPPVEAEHILEGIRQADPGLLA